MATIEHNATAPMSPDTFRAIRDRHGWSQAQLAKLLGCIGLSVHRWESGARQISAQLALLMTLLDVLPGARKIAMEQMRGREGWPIE